MPAERSRAGSGRDVGGRNVKQILLGILGYIVILGIAGAIGVHSVRTCATLTEHACGWVRPHPPQSIRESNHDHGPG